jgi:hypothetical protein
VPQSAIVAVPLLTGGELQCLVNVVDSVNATTAADMALAHLSMAVARLGRSTKSISVTLGNSRNIQISRISYLTHL